MKIKNYRIIPSWGDIPICKHKSFEYQFERSSFMGDDLFEFKLTWSCKRDHAGINFTFGVKYLFWMNLNIHDHRHWNEETNSWQEYDTH